MLLYTPSSSDTPTLAPTARSGVRRTRPIPSPPDGTLGENSQFVASLRIMEERAADVSFLECDRYRNRVSSIGGANDR